jgi:hypothetical protein
MRIGVTGHRLLSERTSRLVEEALVDRLARLAGESLVGITCLAEGADQLFAQAVLRLGGTLEVVLPAARFREEQPPEQRPRFDRLVALATTVEVLAYDGSTSEAYSDAGRQVVERSDVLLAVWDGHPARGSGGTGDVVAFARSRRTPVEVVWPPGAERWRVSC